MNLLLTHERKKIIDETLTKVKLNNFFKIDPRLRSSLYYKKRYLLYDEIRCILNDLGKQIIKINVHEVVYILRHLFSIIINNGKNKLNTISTYIDIDENVEKAVSLYIEHNVGLPESKNLDIYFEQMHREMKFIQIACDCRKIKFIACEVSYKYCPDRINLDLIKKNVSELLVATRNLSNGIETMSTHGLNDSEYLDANLLINASMCKMFGRMTYLSKYSYANEVIYLKEIEELLYLSYRYKDENETMDLLYDILQHIALKIAIGKRRKVA